MFGWGVSPTLEGLARRIEVAGDNNLGTDERAGETTSSVGGARFVRVLERPGTDSRFHLSEIEVFPTGVTPDEAGPSNTVNGPNLSTNDFTAFGFDAATTTSSLEHGDPNGVFDGDHESGGAVWSAANGQSPPEPRYTLDLGLTLGLETIRVFPRNDTCCQDRFANLTVEVYADDGTGNPGALVDSVNGPDNAPLGTNQALEVTVDAPLTSAEILAELFPVDTYVFELGDPDSSPASDQLAVPNPQPGLITTTLDVNGANLEVELLFDQIEAGDTWTLLAADAFQGQFSNIILPELEGGLTFDTSRLLVDGTLSVTAAVIPEPSTFVLAGLALLGLACFGWRARRR